VYVGIVSFGIVMYSVISVNYTFATVRGSRQVHTKLMSSILASTFRYVHSYAMFDLKLTR
jgi:hypothetical protein